MRVVVVVFWSLLVAISDCAILPFLQIPRHDGVKRVGRLTAENFTSVVTAAEISVVVVSQPIASGKAASCPSELDSFAEITAQVLRKKNSIVCEASADVISAADAANPSVLAGDVYIYKKGRGFPYYGKRSTRALLNHLFKVNGTQINVITGKIDKIAFDAVQQVKVAGFFMQGTADYQVFLEAAASFSPSVLFYVAFDRVVAKHLLLDTVGQINLIKPFSKIPVPCVQNPATLNDIEVLIKSNQDSLLSKLNEQNLYDPLLIDPNRLLVLAIGEESSSLGGYFYHLVTKLVRNNTNTTSFEKLNIVWIEPQIFPMIHLVMEELETTLGIPNTLPAFGALNVTTMKSSWLNTSMLNISGSKPSEQQNLQVLQEFLTNVVNNSVTPIKMGAQSFVQVPTSQTATENSDVILECVVENPIGDCLWLSNGHNIGFNLDRFPHYGWRGDRTAGDCSLVISGVVSTRDQGEWVCEVTGDHDSPTITSPPAKLLITAPETAEVNKSEL